MLDLLYMLYNTKFVLGEEIIVCVKFTVSFEAPHNAIIPWRICSIILLTSYMYLGSENMYQYSSEMI